MAARDILAEVLALPPEERARMVRALLRSLEPDREADTTSPDAIERAWTEEIGHRLDDLEAGTAPTDEWSSVRDDLRAALHARHPGR